MNSYPKYQSPAPFIMDDRSWPSRRITCAPIWASVDLRDGNQSFAVPMNVQQKCEYFRMLTAAGFKEIEVAFPSASQDDFDFVRTLIEQDMIPADVRISVFTQLRKHLIERTVESLRGARNAVVHSYIATSDLHGRFVFRRNRDEIKRMVGEGTKMIADAVAAHDLSGKIAMQFSPEEFTDSDINFIIDLCCEVKNIWGEAKRKDFIINLPSTVERRPPYEYADMIEYFCRHYPYREQTTISVHAHNDQGCAVAASEMAVLAGADRVEGVLCGHGERTGNMDIMVLALNLQSRGIVTGLDFSTLPKMVQMVENVSGIPVGQRHPYAGGLVFTAFSGSHQDAIRKGFSRREEISEHFRQGWKIPYLHIDPADIGRGYEGLIRINSQSGKGGVAFVLETVYGIKILDAVMPELGKLVQEMSDNTGREISAAEVMDVFQDNFMMPDGKYALQSFTRVPGESVETEQVKIRLEMQIDGIPCSLCGQGNGPIDAVVSALRQCPAIPRFSLEDFSEKALSGGADAKALAWIGISDSSNGARVYGAGVHGNIDCAAVSAIFAALNRMAQ